MKHQFIICQGIPASGKSTWAIQWAKEDPEHRVRINMDSIRNMFGEYWVPARESLVRSCMNQCIETAMLMGFDIVLDNMNLNEYEQERINELIKNCSKTFDYEIKHKQFFDVSLEECIERDKHRENPIGADVITGIYNKYRDILEPKKQKFLCCFWGNWAGENETYRVEAEKASDLEQICEDVLNDLIIEWDGYQEVADELGTDDDDIISEKIGEYFGYRIEEYCPKTDYAWDDYKDLL
jgi:predicted kinase